MCPHVGEEVAVYIFSYFFTVTPPRYGPVTFALNPPDMMNTNKNSLHVDHVFWQTDLFLSLCAPCE